MSNRRMITTEIWQDDFIGSLSFFERLMWLGLITLADDQGRLINNPVIVMAHAFPYDRNVTFSQVSTTLEKIVKAGKVVAYEVNGKGLLQIVNWWNHQSPQWVQSSKYPAPQGWVDRIKRHTSDNKVEMINWDKKGGFSLENAHPVPDDVPSDVPTPVPSGIEEYDDESSREESREELTDSGETAPPKKSSQPKHKKQKSESDPRSKHPAIMAFRSATQSYPSKVLYDSVISALGDEPDTKKLTDVFVEWRLRGFKPTNIGGILEWYKSGIPPRNGSPPKQNEPKGFEAVRQIREEIERGS